MKKYIVLKQKYYDERLFEIRDLETKKEYTVDLYTNGNFIPPVGADETMEDWKKWLKETFEGKIIEIENIVPYVYFLSGKANIIETC